METARAEIAEGFKYRSALSDKVSITHKIM